MHPYHFLEESPTGFESEPGFNPYGYFTPAEAVGVKDVSLYGLIIDLYEEYDAGDRMEHAFMFDFATPDGAYLKVFPTAYRANASEVVFVGQHEQLGAVLFFGTFNTSDLLASLKAGTPMGSDALLAGDMTVKGHIFYGIPFTWASGP